ncbi:MAG: tdcA, partial [Candidatus Acidoferrum typicum]|nr:tdcA [Candidatus Acidoferrum typicum]
MSKPTDSKDAAAARQKTEWQAYVEDFREAGHQTVDWIAAYLSNVAEMPVLAQTKPGDLLDALPKSAPEKGESFDAILGDFERLVMPAVT